MKIYRKIGAVREQQYQNDVFVFGITVDTETPCEEYPLRCINITFNYCPECGGKMPEIDREWNTFAFGYEEGNDKPEE